jgi:hypothetical protein
MLAYLLIVCLHIASNSPISLAFSPDDSVLSYLHAEERGQMTRQVSNVDVDIHHSINILE